MTHNCPYGCEELPVAALTLIQAAMIWAADGRRPLLGDGDGDLLDACQAYYFAIHPEERTHPMPTYTPTVAELEQFGQVFGPNRYAAARVAYHAWRNAVARTESCGGGFAPEYLREYEHRMHALRAAYAEYSDDLLAGGGHA